jgi:hypothetical protein
MLTSTNALANAGCACSLKHLKSLHTFPEKSGKVMLADSFK